MNKMKLAVALSAASLLAACGSDSDDNGVNYPSTYEFSSKVTEGESSVAYSGQTTRQLLIDELKYLTKADVLANVSLGKGDALDKLNAIYANGVSSDGGLLQDANIYGTGSPTDVVIAKDAPANYEQSDYDQVFDVAGAKNLQGKMAGCDNDLSMSEFIGWDFTDITLVGCDDEVTTPGENDKPHSLVQAWFDELAGLAADNEGIVNDKGHDLQQLVQKFLFGAVTYSQAARDYLKADKGLLKQNSSSDDGDAYTALEHQWDEGFGYFGASRDYLSKTDAEIKASAESDINGNGKIDLLGGEYNYGLAVYASKVDTYSDADDLNLSADAMEAFLEGRQIIQDNFGTDPVEGEGYHVQLVEASERALAAMEKTIAGAAIHYINSTIEDAGNYDMQDASTLAPFAKHWSELKGFALSLQFSPVAIISEQDLKDVHAKIGTTPKADVETNAAQFIADLEAARAILVEAYGFDATVAATW